MPKKKKTDGFDPEEILNDDAFEIYKSLKRHFDGLFHEVKKVDDVLLIQAAFYLEGSLKLMRRLKNGRFIESYTNGNRGVKQELNALKIFQASAYDYMKTLGVGPVNRKAIEEVLKKVDKKDPILSVLNPTNEKNGTTG